MPIPMSNICSIIKPNNICIIILKERKTNYHFFKKALDIINKGLFSSCSLKVNLICKKSCK